MKKRVNVQELADGILLRLFLIASHFAQDQQPDEATDWRHIAAATRSEIDKRGLSPEQVAFFTACDAPNLVRITVAFEQEQARERCRRLQ
jgi:hypothetical protein